MSHDQQKQLTKKVVLWSTVFGGLLIGFSGIGFFVYSVLTFGALSGWLTDELITFSWCITAFLILVMMTMIPVYRAGINYMNSGFEEEEED